MPFHAKLARCACVFSFLPALVPLVLPTAVAAQSDHYQIAAVCQSRSNSVQQLAEISNTRNGDISCLSVKFSGDAIEALRIENHRFAAKDDTPPAEEVKVAEFSVAQIESRQGAVLDGTKGHDAVIVRGHVSSANGNADLVTSYLYNGLTGEYHSCRIKLDHQADSAWPAWRLINQFNETVSHIVVRTRHVPVLGTIGIANLEGACTPAQS